MIHRASFVSADQPLYFSSNVVRLIRECAVSHVSGISVLHSCIAHQRSAFMYSALKPNDNYATSANVFVLQFNGFMSLTSYFDVKYRY